MLNTVQLSSSSVRALLPTQPAAVVKTEPQLSVVAVASSASSPSATMTKEVFRSMTVEAASKTPYSDVTQVQKSDRVEPLQCAQNNNNKRRRTQSALPGGSCSCFSHCC